MLFICGLPIGNPQDISSRVLETLQSVDFIAAEDTRTAGLTLSKFNIHKPFIAYHDFSTETRTTKIIDLLKSGKKIALVTDAGMPLISDPGFELIRELQKQKLPIQVVPGPSAFLAALVMSGLPADRFCFEGFLKSKKSARQAQLQELVQETRTLIFYEAPHRICEALQDLLEILGDREIFIVRELTKKYEEYFCGKISELIVQIKNPLGEYVLVVSGVVAAPAENIDLSKLINSLKQKKLSNKDILEIITENFEFKPNEIKKLLF